MPSVADWPGWGVLPAGFEVIEPPGTQNRYRAAVEIRYTYTIFTEGDRSSRSQVLYSQRVQDLWNWAERYGYKLLAYRFHRPFLYVGDGRDLVRGPDVPVLFFICRTERLESVRRSLPDGRVYDTNTFTCDACHGLHPIGTFICPISSELVACPTCQAFGKVVTYTGHGYVCNVCGAPCAHDGCVTTVRTNEGYRFCDQHATHSTCCACGRYMEWGGSSANPEPWRNEHGHHCERCAGEICPGCGVYAGGDMLWSSHHHSNVCSNCRRQVFTQTGEAFEEERVPIEKLETIPGRESIRKCGVEIEGANGTLGGNDLARRLYDKGVTATYRMLEHQAGDGYGKVHVERDGTVDWECVMGPLNMADGKDAKLLNSAVAVIRDMVRKKELGLDLRCGLHIHVSAERVGLHQAYNLSHLFSYLEDPLFRIGAAKWPYHRASQGSNYCAPIPKYDRKTDFYNNYGGIRGNGRTNHYFALSFSNYFNAKMRNCDCGAVAAGMWDECTCPGLGKCTFEFRLFNTTANPKKITAYLALSQALVAKAISMDEIKNPTGDFPGLEFNRQVFKEMDETNKAVLIEAWKPRVDFILNELPMTTSEREAVLYCIRNCEIATGLDVRELTAQEVTA